MLSPPPPLEIRVHVSILKALMDPVVKESTHFLQLSFVRSSECLMSKFESPRHSFHLLCVLWSPAQEEVPSSSGTGMIRDLTGTEQPLAE